MTRLIRVTDTRAPLLGGAGEGLLEIAVAVGGDDRLVGRDVDLLGRVQPTLELAEDRTEQQVAPGRLGERARVGRQRGEVAGGGMDGGEERGQRPRGDV